MARNRNSPCEEGKKGEGRKGRGERERERGRTITRRFLCLLGAARTSERAALFVSLLRRSDEGRRLEPFRLKIRTTFSARGGGDEDNLRQNPVNPRYILNFKYRSARLDRIVPAFSAPSLFPSPVNRRTRARANVRAI